MRPSELVLCCAAAAACAFGTAGASAQVSSGLKGGLVVSTMSGAGASRSARVGGGTFVAVGLSPTLGLRQELLYVQKGADWSATSLRLHYLEFPALATYRVPVRLQARPQLFLGPAVGVTLHADWSEAYRPGVSTPDAGTLQWALVGGAALDLPLGDRVGAVAELRYEHDLKAISPFAAGVHNEAIMAWVGLSFAEVPGARRATPGKNAPPAPRDSARRRDAVARTLAQLPELRLRVTADSIQRGFLRAVTDTGLVLRSGGEDHTIPFETIQRIERRQRSWSIAGGMIGSLVGFGAGVLAGCALDRDSYGGMCSGGNDDALITTSILGTITGAVLGSRLFGRHWRVVDLASLR